MWITLLLLSFLLHAIFQSTLPVKGATILGVKDVTRSGISIHAPREGSDVNPLIMSALVSLFQSTLPVKGATAKNETAEIFQAISIHAPREGSDLIQVRHHIFWIIFQSTLPVKERRLADCSMQHNLLFQSTLPVKGATV